MSIPSTFISRRDNSYIFCVFGSGTESSLSMPSKPAFNKTESAKYGLAEGSTERISKRLEFPCELGTRSIGVLFCFDHAIAFGASNPEDKRLYELSSGLVTAV